MTAAPNRHAQVLAIGDLSHREFVDAVAWLQAHTQLTVCHTVDAARAPAGPTLRAVDVVVLAQARPAQFSATDVTALIRAFPLARFVALLGSLCEGEVRSGHPWPGVVRVYWHQWPARCTVEFRAGDRPTAWQLPRTASPVERILHELFQPLPVQPGLVAIVTARQAQFRQLAAACQPAGLAAAWVRPGQSFDVVGADAAVWDGSVGGRVDWDALRALATALGSQVPVVVLLDFPRIEDLRQARTCGGCTVLARPFSLPDLWSTLQSAIASHRLRPA